MPILEEALARGKVLRKAVPRTSHSELVLPERDPVGIIEEQNASRLPHLVPVRIGRMLQSPFTFYRGTAGVMAHDLSAGPQAGPMPVCCGDAHVSNFGLFGSPEREILFDLNDFDEAGIAPFEWDLKRMTTSVVLAIREVGGSDDLAQETASRCATTYRQTLHELLGASAMARYYYSVSADSVLTGTARAEDRKVVQRAVRKAGRRTSDQLIDKLTTSTEDGVRSIVDDPPIVARLNGERERALAFGVLRRYERSAREDIALLLSKFRVCDVALRVVGVGSVGTRCFIALLEGPADEPLFLQAKEAVPSVLETYGRVRQRPLPGVSARAKRCEGRRVVAYQRVLQAASDPFLGWTTNVPVRSEWDAELIDAKSDFYFRQFRDMKGSIDLATLTSEQVGRYGVLCARLLARAHSQSPEAMEAAGYLGNSTVFDEAVGRWSLAYADVATADHAALQAAADSGRLPVEYGI